MLYAANYEVALSDDVAIRKNGTAAKQDRDSIRGSIHKAYKTAQIVAADLGHPFHPFQAPHPETGLSSRHSLRPMYGYRRSFPAKRP